MIPAALLLGLAGSLHCIGMCGPLALALPGGNRRWGPLLFGRLLYNGGRVVTYTLIGAVMGWLGRLVQFAGLQQILSIAIGVSLLASLVLLRHAAFVQPLVRRVQGAVARLLRVQHAAVLLPIGLLNGLLPCGLVYAAAAAAAVQGGVLHGMVFMFSFGLGTVPVMLGLSLAPGLFGVHRFAWAQRALPIALAVTGVLLVLRGLGLGIPYLSPAFAEVSACCFDLPSDAP